MRRPGPLKDLPLEPFLHPNSNVPDNLKPFNCPRPNKRPHSPAAPILFSPAKRRILNEEGITFPGKTLRSIPSSRTRLAASSSDFLGDTPAKKLDFGPPKGHQQLVPSIPSCTAEPRSRSPSGSIASSSDISVQPNAIHQPSTSYITLDSDVPSSTTTVPRRSSRLRGSPHSVAPISMPRDMPSPPDRQSIHYPGFDTFQDDQQI
ncbi:hypothetical protein SERLADRAFT_461796 [Serpula lacrymans var. lacrymans S7.9]|uniref:Uncharacterized protein n=1 Tax=Serpula lacrymans var. lacrymans (strain S7.9) TaxID=578457 RepID=F8NPX6_SERL9|nr:uncharacterized protein SERLADRAFT_461796 [Serpula lacrymans var. lacrymans S7.9]EGO27764.1 hypothetical protein SERLADRAFT_461796 [Serpula lacrymans var. lacrymans S7.9]